MRGAEIRFTDNVDINLIRMELVSLGEFNTVMDDIIQVPLYPPISDSELETAWTQQQVESSSSSESIPSELAIIPSKVEGTAVITSEDVTFLAQQLKASPEQAAQTAITQ